MIPPIAFIFMNYASYKLNIFASMERSADSKDKASLGTVYYAVSMTVMAALSLLDARYLLCYGMGMFCMAFGDGLAPCFGSIKKGNHPLMHGKRSVYGSCSVLVVTAIVILTMTLLYSMPLKWFEILILALAAALLELIGIDGHDNLTLPIGTSALAYLFVVL
ncbi:MAG: hypothetical protein PHS97_01710 [Oscillospiraceae bacterium]|nr:hypothetical protein [Oscillospiraceae bacterium]